MLCETVNSFFGKGMVPKSQKWQTVMAMPLREAEPFTLKLRQSFDGNEAKSIGKAQASCLQYPQPDRTPCNRDVLGIVSILVSSCSILNRIEPPVTTRCFKDVL